MNILKYLKSIFIKEPIMTKITVDLIHLINAPVADFFAALSPTTTKPLDVAAQANILAARALALIPSLEGVAIGDSFSALGAKWQAFVANELAAAEATAQVANENKAAAESALPVNATPTAADVTAALTAVANASAT